MAERLVFNFDASDPVKTMARFASRAPNAVRRALNRAAVSARTVLVKRITEDTGLKFKDVRDKVKIQNATLLDLRAEVSASGRPIPLIKFNARGPEPSRGRGRGVTAWKGRIWPHTFIATVGSSRHRGVFMRVTKKRLPIKQVYGPSLADIFQKHMAEAAKVGEESLVKNLQHELSFALGQTGP